MKPLPTKNPHVVFQRVTDGAVLLSTRDEVYFGLDPVGARIWELLTPEVDSLDALALAMAEQYPDVGVDVLRGDAEELLRALVEAGLLVDGAPD